MSQTKNGGRRIFLYFFLFFALVAAVNAVFIYMALRTHAGTVTDNAYEKGLAYNAVLSASRSQPALQERAALDEGLFRWDIRDEGGAPLRRAQAKAVFFRPVKSGRDFEVALEESAPGQYEARPDFPEPGLWTAQLDATWNDKQYRTSQSIMVK